jgi:hypothetical protein
MTTLFARGGSLAALAAALALALPAAAQELTFQPDEPDPPGIRVERPSSGTDYAGGPARAEIARPASPPPRYARADAAIPAPRFERVAAEQRQPRIRNDGRAERGAPRGFAGDVITRARAAQPAEQRGFVRADRIERRSEERANRVDWRSEQRANRIEQRGDVRADRLEWRGRDYAADRVDQRTENRADRVERRGDYRGDRIEQRGNIRANRVEGRPGGWREGQGGGFGGQVREIARDARRADQWRDGGRDDWRDGRRDDWRDGRRGDWRDDRRGWRRDDWRWGWNGRPGWDNRAFHPWNRGWRANRFYDWFDFRRGNQFLFRPGPYFAPFRSHRYSRVDRGFFLDSLFFQPRFFINDPWAFRLPPAYGPYQWVRYYDDVLLVDIYTGEVVDVIHSFFW